MSREGGKDSSSKISRIKRKIRSFLLQGRRILISTLLCEHSQVCQGAVGGLEQLPAEAEAADAEGVGSQPPQVEKGSENLRTERIYPYVREENSTKDTQVTNTELLKSIGMCPPPEKPWRTPGRRAQRSGQGYAAGHGLGDLRGV